MSDEEYIRLSDKVLDALNLALEQKDIHMAEVLSRALELALTRNAGGEDFEERRDFSDAVEDALTRFEELRKSS